MNTTQEEKEMEQVQNPGKGKTNHRRQKGKEKMKVRTERKKEGQNRKETRINIDAEDKHVTEGGSGMLYISSSLQCKPLQFGTTTPWSGNEVFPERGK